MKRVIRVGRRRRIELTLEGGPEGSLGPAPVAELAPGEKAHVWTRTWRSTRRQPDSQDAEGGLSASWHNRLTVVGAALAAVGLYEAEWAVALLGLAGVAYGAWSAMRRLSSGVSLRSLGWIAVEVAVVWAGLGLILVLGLDGVWMWIAAIGIALASPFVATRVSGARELA